MSDTQPDRQPDTTADIVEALRVYKQALTNLATARHNMSNRPGLSHTALRAHDRALEELDDVRGKFLAQAPFFIERLLFEVDVTRQRNRELRTILEEMIDDAESTLHNGTLSWCGVCNVQRGPHDKDCLILMARRALGLPDGPGVPAALPDSTDAPESMLNWTRAMRAVEAVERHCRALRFHGAPLIAWSFTEQLIEGVQRRYHDGERTRALYEQMLSWEGYFDDL